MENTERKPLPRSAFTLEATPQGFVRISPLRLFREEKCLTQSQLSDLSGIHTNQISRLERGERSPEKLELATAAKLAKALGIHAEELLQADK